MRHPAGGPSETGKERRITFLFVRVGSVALSETAVQSVY